MTDIAIQVKNLSKRYQIGQLHQHNDTLRDALVAKWQSLRGRSTGGTSTTPHSSEPFWALRDVSFEVKKGEVVGIIGPNGAGKSTLLKILSRITEPTSGIAQIRGRVGSLLEVGTGFHPELTGRENIYLSGNILGMRRAEISQKLDEIIDFSGIEAFIDTPVKRYSSGMNVRLGFAVAAHLEPEVLLIDEVLAVGDASFQRKCLGKMGDVAREGRTVIFVSHNMAAIGTLCDWSLLLRNGAIHGSGPSSEIIDYYLRQVKNEAKTRRTQPDDAGSGFTLHKHQSEVRIVSGANIELTYDISCPQRYQYATTGIVVYNLFGEPIFGASSKLQGIYGEGNSLSWRIKSDFGQLPLNGGEYMVSIWFGDRERDYARFSQAIALHVTAGDPFAWGNRVPKSWGPFYWKPEWQINGKP